MSEGAFGFVFVLFVIVGVIITLLLIGQKADCDKRGGAYVKGLYWYECVATPQVGDK